MEEIGVMAVVKELSKFQGDMGKIDSAISGIVPSSGLLGSALSTLGDIASSVGGWIANTLAVAIGNLLADAVEWAAQKLQELITSAIDAGNEFQALEIRLNQMNFNTAIDSGMEYTDAIRTSTDQTKEQLLWIQRLATVTPFELSDISQVYGMARSYGFADDEAQDLVTTLGDFTAGMGLNGDAMVSVIRQFGQMRNTGKILQKDLNSLAEGGMVPVNKLLDIMKEKTGLSGKAFDEFKTSAAGAEMFLATFTEYVKTNYTGAAEKANRTLKNATITLKEFFSSFAASNVVKPIMDILGDRIAGLNDALQARLPDIISGFERVGTALSGILTEVLDLGPSSEDMANMFVDGLNGIADWLTSHKQDIVDFFKKGADFVTNTLIPKLKELKDWFFGKEFRMQEGTQGFLEKIIQGLRDMKPLIQPVKELFDALLKVGAAVFNIDLGKLGDQTFAQTVQSIADAISNLATFISDNAETIGFFIQLWIKMSIVMTILSGVISFLISVVISVVGFFGGLYTIVTLVVTVFGFLGTVIGAIAGAITAPILAIAVFVALLAWAAVMVYQHGEEMWTTIQQLGFLIVFYLGQAWEAIKVWATNTWTTFTEWASNVWTTFMEFTANTVAAIGEWAASTMAKIVEWSATFTAKINELKQSVINKFQELVNAIKEKLDGVKQAIIDAFTKALDAVKGINFASAGQNIINGIISGVQSGAGALASAVADAAQSALDALEGALQISSPSKLTMKVGMQFDEGLALGIEKYATLVSAASKGVGATSLAPMVSSPAAISNVSNVSSQSTVNKNFNLNVNTAASSEPIIQDFAMMQAVIG